MVLQRGQAQRKRLGRGHDVFHCLQLGHIVTRLSRHLQAGVIGGQARQLIALDGALYVALAPVVGRQRQVPVAEHAVQAGQVIERGAGRGQHIAAVVAKDVLAQVEVAPRGRHELPHTRGTRARHGLRVEGAFDEGQQGQLRRQVALLHLLDDVEQIAPAALGHALHVLGLPGVVQLALAHKIVIQVGNAEAIAHALP